MATSSNSAADWSLGVRSKIALRVFASHLAGVRCCPLVRRSCWPASRSPEPVLSDPPRPRCCYLVQAVGLVLLGARQGAVEGQGLPVGGQGLLMTTQIIQGATDIDQAAGLLTLSAGQSAAKTQGPREGGGCLLQAPGIEQPDTLVEGLLGTPEELVTGVPLPVCHDCLLSVADRSIPAHPERPWASLNGPGSHRSRPPKRGPAPGQPISTMTLPAPCPVSTMAWA